MNQALLYVIVIVVVFCLFICFCFFIDNVFYMRLCEEFTLKDHKNGELLRTSALASGLIRFIFDWLILALFLVLANQIYSSKWLSNGMGKQILANWKEGRLLTLLFHHKN